MPHLVDARLRRLGDQHFVLTLNDLASQWVLVLVLAVASDVTMAGRLFQLYTLLCTVYYYKQDTKDESEGTKTG